MSIKSFAGRICARVFLNSGPAAIRSADYQHREQAGDEIAKT
jgi:hypothetical protein